MKELGPLVLGIFGTFAFSWVGLTVIPNLQIGHLDPQADEEATDVYPSPRSGMAERGRRIYIANGCVYCHTQQVRPDYAGADLERKWGQRRSAPRDYIFDRPVLLGRMRMGPDLANIGHRAPVEDETAPAPAATNTTTAGQPPAPGASAPPAAGAPPPASPAGSPPPPAVPTGAAKPASSPATVAAPPAAGAPKAGSPAPGAAAPPAAAGGAPKIAAPPPATAAPSTPAAGAPPAASPPAVDKVVPNASNASAPANPETAAQASPPNAQAPGEVTNAVKGTPLPYTSDWHHRHLYNPRSITLDSNMPAYRFLYQKRKVEGQPSPDALKFASSDAPTEGWEIVPTYDAQCLVAYLMSLDQSHDLNEVKSASPPSPAAPGKAAGK